MVVMNGCDSLVERPDLVSRVLQFNFSSIEGERLETDQKLMEEFQKVKPKILGVIFEIISCYLEEKDDVKIDNYVIRLTEFQRVAVVLNRITYGEDEETVDSLLETNKKEMNIQLLEENPVAVLILHFMERRVEWSGSVTDLYDRLDTLAYKEQIGKNYYYIRQEVEKLLLDSKNSFEYSI